MLATLIWFFLFRRRNNGRNHGDDVERPVGGGFSPIRNFMVNRKASVLSRTGLLKSSDDTDNEKPDLRVNTAQVSRQPSGGTSGIMDPTPVSASTADNKRNSRHMFVDSRLDPKALMAGDNGSRTSIGTIQDNMDYTRRLGITNPDPPGHDYYH
ncbi:MAG: hypothetical protein M1820_004646 [Bogoriella megaspora]|nr:MAG: hypothetical protein M1820_004646 [Bogoriella megaspora]